MGRDALQEMERRHFVRADDLGPKVLYRLADNWLQLTGRFVCPPHRLPDLKDGPSRGILDGLGCAGIPLESTTIEVVGLPPVRLPM